MRKSSRQQWGVLAFIFVFLAALLFFVFMVSREPAEDEQKPAADATSLVTFWDGLAQRAPEYKPLPYDCPVDGTQFDVPRKVRDNRYGGVASDLMKISLAPPEQEYGLPDLSRQEWELMPATCPTCGATFMEIDLINLQSAMVSGGLQAVRSWNLGKACPPLKNVPHVKWTSDERLFVHYLTLKQAGFPGTELGYAALTAAYGSNFSIWYGQDYSVPSVAYYALAAALMRKDLEAGLPASDAERAAVMFDLGELYRLLGRADDSARWFAQAKDSGHLEQSRLEVLKQLEDSLAAGDFALQRVKIEGLTAPPVGWYLDTMLPAINGHITEHRAEWNTMDDPAAIERAIGEHIAAKHQP